MVFGEKVRKIPKPERNWVLGNLPIKEVLTWKNLSTIWNANNKFDSTIDIVLKKGYAVIDMMVTMVFRNGSLNPKVATELRGGIALPHLLYGCELWYLTLTQFSKLEKIQNLFCRKAPSLLPGTSGSEARGLMGLGGIETDISRIKLYFLGRIINCSSAQAFKELFVCRLIKWKWRCDAVNRFIPDLIRILEKYGLMMFKTDFYTIREFSDEMQWKRIVNEVVQRKEELTWSEKLNQKPVLKLYMQADHYLNISFWYEIWDFAPINSNIVVDVIRLLCGSFKIDSIRIKNYNCLLSFYCSFC
ncbi:Hypothetical predicted protein [Paramuricea clavata]|uniref:Uncharacterized protein n=1 Tax=Paramuricea clavata TaxID=317549 RepID=A0A6S7JUN2_PARCT|nr:Hypothetical predicted protein [Paramuricea clavata]